MIKETLIPSRLRGFVLLAEFYVTERNGSVYALKGAGFFISLRRGENMRITALIPSEGFKENVGKRTSKQALFVEFFKKANETPLDRMVSF